MRARTFVRYSGEERGKKVWRTRDRCQVAAKAVLFQNMMSLDAARNL